MKQESAPRKIVVEQSKRFSESMLWKLQRDYFDKEGINAWVNQVPFYITSNPYIAKCYAKVVVSFIREWVAKNPDAAQHPFYMMELGTGSGRFSFFLVKTIRELLAAAGLSEIKFCYVMSDFTRHNIQYWESHPALKSYVEEGIIDFAIYDMENEKPITLVKKNLRLTNDVLVNPLMVFANYIFDTVSHDSFTAYNGRLFELLVTLSTEENNIDGIRPIDMEKVTVDHSIHEAKQNYYNDPVLDNILETYRANLKESSFLIPVGAIRAIKLLKKLSNNKLMIISTDKGYSSVESLEGLGNPSIAFHGSFSMMVNFHAIAEYFKNTGGDYYLQTPRRGIKTCVFTDGFQLKDFPETSYSIQEYVEGVSPSDYFTLHGRVRDHYEDYDLDTLASHLTFACWDPHIYLRINNRINSLVNEADSETIIYLAEHMHKIAKNYYHMPKSECVLFELAIFYHAIKHYETALDYYQQAAPFVGEKFGLIYNQALCRQLLKDSKGALADFKHALTLDPDSTETKEWIAFIENELANG